MEPRLSNMVSHRPVRSKDGVNPEVTAIQAVETPELDLQPALWTKAGVVRESVRQRAAWTGAGATAPLAAVAAAIRRGRQAIAVCQAGRVPPAAVLVEAAVQEEAVVSVVAAVAVVVAEAADAGSAYYFI